MNYIGKFITNFKEFYNEINSATLTGAIDVIVIKQADNTYLCSPFHVRFGKMGVLRSKEKVVDIMINDIPVDIHMKLGDNGEAFFVEELPDELHQYDLPGHLATSPLPDFKLDNLEGELYRLKNEQYNNNNNNNNIQNNKNNNNSFGVLTETSEHQTVIDMPTPNKPSIFESSIRPDSGQKKRRRRRGQLMKISTSKTEKIEDQSLDLENLDDGHLDEYSLYDDEFEKSNKFDGEDEDAGSSSQDELECLTNNSLARSTSMAIPNSFSSHSLSNMQSSAVIADQTQQQEKSSVLQSGNSSTMIGPLKPLPSDFHPFSDGEMSPFPSGSPKKQFERPCSPKSDTEYEINRNSQTQSDSAELSWQWGELPQVSRKVSVNSHRSSQMSVAMLDDYRPLETAKGETNKEKTRTAENISKKQQDNNNTESKSGVFKNVLTLLRKDEKSKPLTEEGIYLDDLNPDELAPEVLERYLPKMRSSIQFPTTRVSDDETESGNGSSLPNSPKSGQTDIENCIEPSSTAVSETHSDKTEINKSNLSTIEETTPTNPLELFQQYGQNVALSLCGGLDSEIDTQKFEQAAVSFETFVENPVNIIKNPELVLRINDKYYNWQVASSILISLYVYQKPLPESCLELLVEQQMPRKKKEPKSSWWYWRRSYQETPAEEKPEISNELANQIGANSAEQSFQLSSNADETTDSENEDNNRSDKKKKYRKFHYRKVLRLNSKDIESLNLKEGSNEAVFSVTTAYQGTTRCKCHVYLWNYDDKIIISDIDGTITKSDVLGHILPILGRDWAQSGVANLFTKIKENGYKFLYLSARAIGQAKITREYLKSIRQGDLCLPDGPLLLSPTSLISAFHREVIEKKPEEFKISCLKDIQALFPQNPFYAGFGNKINDTWAYRAVNIPLSRIFTINHRGELKLELIQTFQSSYTRLSDVVDQMFPPLEAKMHTDFLSEYSAFNYWRDVLPSVEIEEVTKSELTNGQKSKKDSSSATTSTNTNSTIITTTTTTTSANSN